jgi:hypothetical protein
VRTRLAQPSRRHWSVGLWSILSCSDYAALNNAFLSDGRHWNRPAVAVLGTKAVGIGLNLGLNTYYHIQTSELDERTPIQNSGWPEKPRLYLRTRRQAHP